MSETTDDKAKFAKGDTVTVKGKGRTKFRIAHIHPSNTGAVLVESGGKGTDKPFSTTYVNAADLKAAKASDPDPAE